VRCNLCWGGLETVQTLVNRRYQQTALKVPVPLVRASKNLVDFLTDVREQAQELPEVGETGSLKINRIWRSQTR